MQVAMRVDARPPGLDGVENHGGAGASRPGRSCHEAGSPSAITGSGASIGWSVSRLAMSVPLVERSLFSGRALDQPPALARAMKR
jgi:hypothetical protein